MGRIVAIAGGDLKSTRELNLHAIHLSGKIDPKVLFIGTASNDAEAYIEKFSEEYRQLGCEVKSLCLATRSYEQDEIDDLLSWADVIYVGGGDTIFMMDIWKQHGLDQKLKEIYHKDKAVLTGISAGAICWFSCGHSDSESFQTEGEWSYCWADGMLDLFHKAFCPHYDEGGRDSFDTMLQEKDLPGLAMENDTAFVENNGKLYFLRSDPEANACEIMYHHGVIEKRKIVF